jgi:hypothetical protein
VNPTFPTQKVLSPRQSVEDIVDVHHAVTSFDVFDGRFGATARDIVVDRRYFYDIYVG